LQPADPPRPPPICVNLIWMCKVIVCEGRLEAAITAFIEVGVSGCPEPPSQIPACGFPAPGSSVTTRFRMGSSVCHCVLACRSNHTHDPSTTTWSPNSG